MIRTWEPGDAAALLPLVHAFLVEHYASGGDIEPTEENAAHLVAMGIHRATSGDPVYLAGDEDGIVGFVLWVGITPGLLTLRGKLLQGIGTYVVPARRRETIGKSMRTLACVHAAKAGYTRIDGVARDDRGFKSAKAAGFTAIGAFVVKEL